MKKTTHKVLSERHKMSKIPKFIKDILISEVTNINGFSSKSIAKKITKN